MRLASEVGRQAQLWRFLEAAAGRGEVLDPLEAEAAEVAAEFAPCADEPGDAPELEAQGVDVAAGALPTASRAELLGFDLVNCCSHPGGGLPLVLLSAG